jgi:hypothetical protein
MMRTALTATEAGRLAEWVEGLPTPFTLTFKEGKVRTLDQNALLHKWFGEIAKQKGDRTAMQVKGECHNEYALAIKMRDPQWAWVWVRTGAILDYEQQCRALTSGVFYVSSGMSVPELSEYMEAMSQAYRSKGFRLTDPEGNR